ncbi:MAG: hypothetical protein Q9164_000771 [Protoblastenia rupestris]
MHEVANPLPNRAKRLQAASNEIQNLYQRSAAKDTNNTSFRSVPLSSGQRKYPNSHAGVDARHLGASIAPSTSQQPIDARNLGAAAPAFKLRYTDGQGSNVTPHFTESATVPQDIKERLRQRAEERRSGGSSSFSSSNRQSQGDFRSRDPRSQESRQNRGRGQDDRRPRLPRKNNIDPTPRSRRGQTQNSDATTSNYRDRDRDPEADVAAEFAFLDEAFQYRIAHPGPIGTEEEELFRPMIKQSYKPPSEGGLEEGLADSIPAFVNGGRGVEALMREQLELAERVLAGEMVQWISKGQRDDTLALVEKIKHSDTSIIVKDKFDKPTLNKEEADKRSSALMQKLFKGSYVPPKQRREKGDVLADAERQATMNSSYDPDDSEILVSEVGRVMTGNLQNRRREEEENRKRGAPKPNPSKQKK